MLDAGVGIAAARSVCHRPEGLAAAVVDQVGTVEDHGARELGQPRVLRREPAHGTRATPELLVHASATWAAASAAAACRWPGRACAAGRRPPRRPGRPASSPLSGAGAANDLDAPLVATLHTVESGREPVVPLVEAGADAGLVRADRDQAHRGGGRDQRLSPAPRRRGRGPPPRASRRSSRLRRNASSPNSARSTLHMTAWRPRWSSTWIAASRSPETSPSCCGSSPRATAKR